MTRLSSHNSWCVWPWFWHLTTVTPGEPCFDAGIDPGHGAIPSRLSVVASAAVAVDIRIRHPASPLVLDVAGAPPSSTSLPSWIRVRCSKARGGEF